MKKYILEFTGRLNCAIGVFHKIHAVVKADNLEAAKLKLYDTYEHIRGVREITEQQAKGHLMSLNSRLILAGVEVTREELIYKGKRIARPHAHKVEERVKEHFNINLI